MLAAFGSSWVVSLVSQTEVGYGTRACLSKVCRGPCRQLHTSQHNDVGQAKHMVLLDGARGSCFQPLFWHALCEFIFVGPACAQQPASVGFAQLSSFGHALLGIDIIIDTILSVRTDKLDCLLSS